jgi:dTDP-glucose pyrophosphorylase
VTDELARCIVRRDASIRDALNAIDRGAGGIVLVVDDAGRLVAIATDGDLRRALLAGHAIDDPLGDVPNERFVAVDAGQSRVDALDLMRGRRISAIPAVDAEGRPVALHLLAGFLRHAPRDNQALIMAGGLGTRLRPLTEDVPKPMLRVAGRPILERIVLHLVGFGIERISISVGYLSEVIERHFGDGTDFGARIDYLREDEPLGTAGALGLLPQPPIAPLVVVNGDLVTSVDVDAMLRAHARGGFAATIGTRRYLHTVPFGCIVRDGERVVSIEEKPTLSREVNAGIYVLDPWVAGLVTRGERATMLDVLAGVLERGETVGAFEVDDDWLDVGQREQLRLAREGA